MKHFLKLTDKNLVACLVNITEIEQVFRNENTNGAIITFKNNDSDLVISQSVEEVADMLEAVGA